MRKTLALAAAAALALAAPASGQQAPGPRDARADIERTLGLVPGMFRVFPEAGLPGAWAEFRDLQLNPNTALPGKVKELIGLAVAAQIPCAYCVYFHTRVARANGATDAEIAEAVAMAAVVRHWSTVLNGMAMDQAEFRREVDAVLARAEAAATQAQQPPRR